MRTQLLWVALGLCLALVGCGGEPEPEGAEVAADAANDGRPPQAAHLRVQHDLLEQSHLADVRHHGLFIDFGGPARNKYTVGNWGSGWGAEGADGDVTFTYVDDTGRVYFPVDEPTDLTLRFQMKPVGSHRMQVFLNNESLEGVVLEEGDVFRTYDVHVPAEHVQRGENYLLLRFGGTTPVDGEDVAVAVGSLRVIEGAPAEDERFLPPQWNTLVSAVELGGVERQALAFRAPTTLSYYLEVPDEGQLVFGVGAEGESTDGLMTRVTVTPEGGEANEIFHARPSSRWNDQALSLHAYRGRVVRLDLSVEGEGDGRVAWSTPAVMVPPPEVAERPEEARNVVVLLIDTLRASKLRPYEPSSRVRTPVFDRITEQGVLFEQAQSPENWTKPSCASVLTGLTPTTHGAKTSEARLPQGAELVSEVFHDAGFATGSFIANGYVSDRFGFDQGWDDYNNFIRDGRSTEAENVFDEAASFIEQNRDDRFFVYIQTIDPHVPYDPPDEYLRLYDQSEYGGAVQPRRTPELLEDAKQDRVTFGAADRRRLEALHDGEISYHDHHLGRFLERLEAMGVAEDTLLVITSDHGEEFDDHGSWGHGHSIFQELLGVPLVFHHPGRLPEGRRVDHTVSTMHIAQTILELTGVEGLERAEGRSLVPDLVGDVTEGPQVAFSDFQEIRRVARSGRYKLVVRANLSSVMFDLRQDPGEEHAREVAEFPVAGRYMRILLGQYLGSENRGQWQRARQDEVQALEAEDAEMDETIRAQLRALGYAN
ncbi:MAG TPA: sulfatase [Sandaracinaceae bacterium LLY-WYZ-13_1]|nr:sulfatase [Sandaracinaceae bacterium LLY-WYZ-13_1]